MNHSTEKHTAEKQAAKNQNDFIKLENLSKVYSSGGTLRAVDNVSLGFSQGEIVTILGPSGSGKSTLLNLVGGIDEATSGKIIIDGKEITSLGKAQLTDYRRDTIGFVFQFYNLIPNLTVAENVEVVADICKSPLEIMPLLKTLGIAEQAKKYPVELSGGQQQRVAIARAIVKNPKILLCDEPTGALDSKSSLDILRLLLEVNRKFNTTILIITHNTAIAGVTHRTVSLRDGQVVQDEINKSPVPVNEVVW